MIPLLITGYVTDQVEEAEEWWPTEMPGVALVHHRDWWTLTHIRSGLALGYSEDRDYLLERGLPVLAGVDWTRSAADLRANPPEPGRRDQMAALGLIIPRIPNLSGEAPDLDQDPALAPLMGAGR